MAAVGVTIVGKDGNGNDITIVGLASLTGLGVGGGPIIPPPVVGQPPHPAFPIAGGPDPGWPNKPGYPDYITGWPVPPWYPGHPGHPIPPVVGGGPIIPPPGGGETPPWKPMVAWSPETGWVVVLVPGEGTLVPTPAETK